MVETAMGQMDNLWRPMTQHQIFWSKPQKRMVTGKGCTITDHEGNTFLDGVAGLWCVNIGYGREELGVVAGEQMKNLGYLAPVMTHGPAVELAEKLQQMLGLEGHVYFTSSGSEANEAAFKIARQYHLQSGISGGERRYKIISRYRAYHGNTMAAMAATGQAERKIGYDPMPPGFLHIMPPYPYRAHPKLTVAEHGEECARMLEETIIHEGQETVAAFIMEPMISGGGVLVPPDNYLPLVREVCNRYRVLLIFDEVVSGFGRTGRMFGHQNWDTYADIFTFAKGISSGYMPLAATMVQEHVFEKFYGDPATLNHFRQINTYGRHPVSTAVGLRNIEILEAEKLDENARKLGEYTLGQIREALRDHPWVGDIRGKGLLMGVELVSDREDKTPLDNTKVGGIVLHCQQNGVLIGRNGNTIPGRCNVLIMAPPLVIQPTEADRMVDALRNALHQALN